MLEMHHCRRSGVQYGLYRENWGGRENRGIEVCLVWCAHAKREIRKDGKNLSEGEME